MNVVMTLLAHHKSLALASRHYLHPLRSFGLSLPLEILQGSDMVYLTLHFCVAELADLGKETLYEFRSGALFQTGSGLSSRVASMRRLRGMPPTVPRAVAFLHEAP